MAGPYRPPPSKVKAAVAGTFGANFWAGWSRDVRQGMEKFPGLRASSWYRPTGRGQHTLGSALDFTGALEERRRALAWFRERGWWGQLETTIQPAPPGEVYNPGATGAHLHVQRFRATEAFKRIRGELAAGRLPVLPPPPPSRMPQARRSPGAALLGLAQRSIYGLVPGLRRPR